MTTHLAVRDPRSLNAGASSSAKVELVDALLARADVAACARTTLQWLGQHTAVDTSFLAVVTGDLERLAGVAGDGVAHAHVEAFSVPLDDRQHPAVIALDAVEPLYFHVDHVQAWEPPPPPPLLGVGFHAIPLVVPEDDGFGPVGVLLAAGLDSGHDHDVAWAMRLLAQRILREQHRLLFRREQRLQRERAVLHRVLNAVPDPVLLSDERDHIHFANAHAEHLLSAGADASEGRRHAVSLNNTLLSAARFTATEHDARLRREVLLVDPVQGDDLLFELIGAAVRMSDGGTGVVSVLRDVNDLRQATQEIEDNYRKLRQAEKQVRAERDRLHLILNAVADPVLVTSPDGAIVRMNPPAQRMFAIDPALEATDHARRRVQANDAMLSTFVSQVWTADVLRWRGELNLVDPLLGDPLPFEAIAGKAISREGTVTGLVTILHDRREALEKARLYEQVKQHSEELRRRVDEATAELTGQNEVLRRQAIELEQASKAKSQFLANMSHELRTPLNAIIGYASILTGGIAGEVNDKQRQQLVRVSDNARHLLSLIEDLLDIARIESGHLPIVLERFSVGKLLAEIRGEMDAMIARSRLTVIVEAAADVPEIVSDRKKVKQMLMNLLANALKFTSEGFVQLRATVDRSEDIVMVAVADTGIGISHNDHELVFEEFKQADASIQRGYGGSGLGLAICKRFAERLGGRITLVSAPSAGSTFTLHLPIQAPVHDEEQDHAQLS